MPTNVTPSTPATYPILYTTNYGQVYEIASLSNQGCADTVYSTSYTAAYTTGAGNTLVTHNASYAVAAVVPASTALGVIQAYDLQFGPSVIACQSLIAQIAPTTSSATTNANFWNLFPQAGTGSVLGDDVVFVIVIAIVIIAIVAFAGWLEHLVKKK